MLLRGLRSAEVLSLTLFDVSFEEGQVYDLTGSEFVMPEESATQP